jgi:AraC family transcriptional activator of pyochelin receptor
MEQAHALLAAGELSVSEAAYACGYTDSHFTKAFQRRYGMLPSSVAPRG